MANKIFLISGKVQGVWFRASTRDEAIKLGLTGYAKNLPDGKVEVVACGEPSAIEKLEAWLWHGPEHANVEEIIAIDHDNGTYQDFTTC